MATNTYWGQSTWDAFNWGGISSDITVLVGGTTDGSWGSLTFGSGPWGDITPDPNLDLIIDTPPVFEGWGLNAWGDYPYGGAESIIIRASANVILSSVELGIITGELSFSGKAIVNVTGEQLTLTINDAVIIAKANADATTNVLDFLVQNPNIIASGNVTDAVVGNELTTGVGTVGFKIDQIFPVTGSFVQIATGTVVVALPTIVDCTGSSVVASAGTAVVVAKSYVDIDGNQVTISTGDPTLSLGVGVTATGSSVIISVGTPTIVSTYIVTGNNVNLGVGNVSISTQQIIQPVGSLLTTGTGSLIVYGWVIIDPTTGQTWSAITPTTGQTWSTVTVTTGQTWSTVNPTTGQSWSAITPTSNQTWSNIP